MSHPKEVARGVPFQVQALLFCPEERDLAIARAHQLMGSDAPFRSGGSAMVVRGTALNVEIKVARWKVEPSSQTIAWTGNVANAPFRVFPSADAPDGNVQGVCKVSIGGLRGLIYSYE